MHKPALKLNQLPGRALWALGAAIAVLCSAGLIYYWRVFYSLDARGWPALPLFAAGAALALAGVLLARLLCTKRLGMPGRTAVCIFAAGLLFCFADPPMQAPDEYNHFLRAYSISEGYLDFDAAREYPEDVASLYNSFPGAWVSAHTSQGLTKDTEGNEVTYNSEGYALKQYGEDGRVLSVLDSFEEYLAGKNTEKVTEPILFMILPFLPQAFGMLLARLFGFAALGCLYGGRLVNLLVYTLICLAALRNADRGRGVLAAFMLNPLSLYMAGSLSYDAQLLGCYYLCASFLVKDRFEGRDAAAFLAAFVWMNIAKPYINLLWLAVIFFLPGNVWAPKLRGLRVRRWQLAAVCAAGAAAVTLLVEWHGRAARTGYGVIGRMLSEDVQQVPQLLFVLKNIPRYAAVLLGTFYENSFFIGQMGTFGALDLPVQFINFTAPAVLLLAAVLCCRQGKRETALPAWGGAAFAVVYAAGAATAMYITYTPVGMVRIIGLQARYFLPAFLMLFWLLSRLLGGLLKPAGDGARAENTCLVLCAVYAALSALLLFQHYFVGPVYLIR